MKAPRVIITFAILIGVLAGCIPEAPTSTPAPTQITQPPQPTEAAEQPLYLAIIWHQHQPLYYKDPETGIYAKPWVRMHAQKDYYDMAAILKEYPSIKATFNLTPSLIAQLEDLIGGARDRYWVLTEKLASELTDDDKRYILQRFFDANPDNVVGVHPRYKELMAKRGGASEPEIEAALGSYSEQDFRDLQVWFNLAWFDPDVKCQEPLKSLVDKGRDFSEEDKRVVLDKALDVMKMVLPIHKELQDAGQIEVTMTPFAHPILPLLYDTNLAAVGMPDAPLPKRFSFPQDAIAHLRLGIERYEKIFGCKPRGMWPAEGSVAQEIVRLVSEAGITWMASGEQVLAKSIGIDSFTRDAREVVQEADELYRPYYVSEGDGRPVGMVFRDLRLSDLIGFEYSSWDGEKAAEDFMGRIRMAKDALEEEGAEGPHLMTVLLDGENAWEYYRNDGKAFLHAMYRKLEEADDIVTVTPSEYLEMFPDQRDIEHLWPGCWFTPDYSTWIGEDEENAAWNLLLKARTVVQNRKKGMDEESYTRAMELIYAAEGSDWFWWYGADQAVADEQAFDQMFRSTLMDIYKTVGMSVPDELYVPIMPKTSPAPAQKVQGMFTPTIDGRIDPAEEWTKAGHYQEAGGAMARADRFVSKLYYGYDKENVYLLVEGVRPWKEVTPDVQVAAYIGVPRGEAVNGFSRFGASAEPKQALGFGAAFEAAVRIDAAPVMSGLSSAKGGSDWGVPEPLEQVTVQGNVVEMAVPFSALGDLEAGDRLVLLAVVSSAGRDVDSAPSGGPIAIVVPDISAVTPILTVDDPAGDDHGPGSYTYPTDGVFEAGCYDLKQFVAGYDERNLVFSFYLNGPISNPWGSGSGLAVQSLDVYIDVDYKVGSGSRVLLPGRNLAVSEEDAWDYAIWAEGWTPGVFKVDANGKPIKLSVALKVIVDPVAQKVTVRVPKTAFPEGDPATWGYLAVVSSQDGFPSTGVWRLRDVEEVAVQWRLGGAPADTNHTRVIDLAWPEAESPTQEEMLSDYPASQEKNMDKLSPDDFAQVGMLRVP